MCILKEISQDQAIDLRIFFVLWWFLPFPQVDWRQISPKNTDVSEDTFYAERKFISHIACSESFTQLYY